MGAVMTTAAVDSVKPRTASVDAREGVHRYPCLFKLQHRAVDGKRREADTREKTLVFPI